MRYSILDPTGNITALVEDAVPVGDQPKVAAWIMKRHPDVEQVGFMGLAASSRGGRDVQASLRMAGGEFCGNASMCAASLYALRTGWSGHAVWLEVSGASEAVCVTLSGDERDGFETSIQMPAARDVRLERLTWQRAAAEVPVVHLEGISHVILEPSSPFFELRHDRVEAEHAIRNWCDSMGLDGLGLMFVEGEALTHKTLTPLVYIPGSDTVFWERSCASGSAAVGMHFLTKTKAPVDLRLQEPGGTLRVEGDPTSGRITLHGHVRLVKWD